MDLICPLTVKPDNDNILFIGGTVLERVDLSQIRLRLQNSEE